MPATIGRYQLLDSMGAGTLGALHRARDLQKGRTVALRVLDGAGLSPDDLAAVRAAAARLVDLSHPAIASLYECVDEADGAALASEFVPGQSLASLVAAAPLHPRRALDLATQLADGLAAAHALDLSHGAVSVDAVIVTPKGTPKLLDVGLSQWTRGGATRTEDDLVGLAALLFQTIVGRPLKRGWPAEFRSPAIPRELQAVLQKMSAPDGYASTALAAADLRDVAAALDATEKPAAAPRVVPRAHTPAPEPSSSRGWLIVVVILLALVVAGVAIARMWVARALY